MGFDIDLGEALAAALGVKVQWEETSFDQMISSLATNRVDAILSGMSDTPERRNTVNFLDYLKDGPQFYTLKERVSEFTSMDALCGKTVAASRVTKFPDNIAKWSAEHCVKAGKPPIILLGTNNSSDSRMQLRQNRVAAAVQGGATLPYQNSVEQNAYAPIGDPFLSLYTGMGLSKSNVELNTAITGAMARLIADGTYSKILAKWGLQKHAIQKAAINADN